ncbi:MAG: hypothetical protein LUG86_02855 [Oscillospiraceae bacterium]|nr:hypothetical protein [Oscillospiraceae bacterium]
MDAKRVIYLLNILRRETNGHDYELNQLYEDAISSDDDVLRLQDYLNNYNFYSGIGGSMRENGEKLINKLRANPYEALKTLESIRQANEMIESEASVCQGLLRSPEPFTESITVLPKKDIMDYVEALKQTANTAVYLIMLYGGMDDVRDLTWSANPGLQEYINAVNTKYLKRLMKVSRPGYSWVISKRKLGGQALFGGDYFHLSFESTASVEILTSTLHREPIGTHAFLNIDAYEADKQDEPYCWGVGNLLSTPPSKALDFLRADVVTKTRSPFQSELTRKIPTPTECLRILTDGRPFCISSDVLVNAMNQWQMGHEIYLRKRNGHCLFCGGTVSGGRLVCPSHFTTEL